LNLCRECGLDFTSVRDFDSHRVGVHAYTFREGLKFEPPVEDGRRCLAVDELHAKGWALDRYGRWRRKQRKVSVSVRGLISEGKKA
jgi:hypothetical protein